MRNILIIRLGGVALLTLALGVFSTVYFKSLFVSMLFSHYLLSVVYAKNRITFLSNEKKTWGPLLVLCLISTIYFLTGAYKPFQVMFTVFHIALSDTYMANDLIGKKFVELDIGKKYKLNLARFLFNSFCFMTLFQKAPLINLIAPFVLYTGVALTGIAVTYLLLSIDQKAALAYAAHELIALIVVCALAVSRINIPIQYLVFYHVMIWLLYPLLMNYQNKRAAEVNKYLLWVLISALFFFVLRGLSNSSAEINNLDAQIPFWASIHFISTFALSKYNPNFIVKFFTPHFGRVN